MSCFGVLLHKGWSGRTPEFSKGGKWVGILGTAGKVTQGGGWRSWEEVTVAEVSWGWEGDWGTT